MLVQRQIFGIVFNKDLFDTKLENSISDIKWGEILKSASHYEKRIRIDDKRYLLIANTIRNRNISISEDEDKVSVYIYLIDRTVEYELKRKYVNEKQMLRLSILIIMTMYCNVSMTTSNNRFWHK